MSDLYRLHESAAPEGEAALYAQLAAVVKGLSGRKARLAITAGLVTVDGELSIDPQAAIRAGQALRVDLRQGIPSAGQQRAGGQGTSKGAGERPFNLLYRDQAVIVIDKASGILAAPTERGQRGHVLEALREWAKRQGEPLPYLGQIHRIDQPTSGCLVVALSKPAQSLLSTQFATHCAERQYRCLVAGGPRQDADRLDGPIGRGPDGRRAVVSDGRPGKEAVTHFTVVKRYAGYSDLSCRLETGRTHQIRVHLAGIGCPVLGDAVYGRRRGGGGLPKVPRLMLHAHAVHFDHPLSGERMHIEAPLPRVYRQLID